MMMNTAYASEFNDGYCGCGCGGRGSCLGRGNTFSCIINLILILIVLQFLASIIMGACGTQDGCGTECC